MFCETALYIRVKEEESTVTGDVRNIATLSKHKQLQIDLDNEFGIESHQSIDGQESRSL